MGLHVADRRRAIGLTQRDLADLAAVSVDSVHAVERGKPSVQLEVLLAVLDALGLALVAVPRSMVGRLDAEAGDAVVVVRPRQPGPLGGGH